LRKNFALAHSWAYTYPHLVRTPCGLTGQRSGVWNQNEGTTQDLQGQEGQLLVMGQKKKAENLKCSRRAALRTCKGKKGSYLWWDMGAEKDHKPAEHLQCSRMDWNSLLQPRSVGHPIIKRISKQATLRTCKGKKGSYL